MCLVQFDSNLIFLLHLSKTTYHCHKLRRDFSSMSLSTDFSYAFFFCEQHECCILNVFNSFTYLNIFYLYVNKNFFDFIK